MQSAIYRFQYLDVVQIVNMLLVIVYDYQTLKIYFSILSLKLVGLCIRIEKNQTNKNNITPQTPTY